MNTEYLLEAWLSQGKEGKANLGHVWPVVSINSYSVVYSQPVGGISGTQAGNYQRAFNPSYGGILVSWKTK